jgi:EpsI family protein
MLAGPGGERRLAYSFYHVGGRLTGVASRVKIETLKARLLGRDQRALAIILSTPVPDGPDGEAEAARVLAGFIGTLGAIEDLADRSLAID